VIRLKEDTNLIDRAVEAAVAAGLCVVPTRREGKAPVAEWKEFQTDRPSPRQLNRWYGYGRTGIGIVCGAVSDRLEALDFDDEAVYIDYVARARASGLGDLVDRVESGYLERTPSGGRHWLTPCAGVRSTRSW
jgi:Bifunctional DNA primase/polymerase, N-terminal